MRHTVIIKTLAELLIMYARAKRVWISRFGSDDGYHEWFTAQVLDTRQHEVQ